jgi:hypothetical protein
MVTDMKRLLAGAGFGALLLSGCNQTFDLAMQDFSVSAPVAAPGAELRVASAVANKGSAAITSYDGVAAPVSVDVQLFSTSEDFAPVFYVTGWGVSSDGLFPGERAADERVVLAPRGLPAGDYTICADVDFQDRIAEKNERNNRMCAPFTLIGEAPTKADLLIEDVKPLGAEKDSQMVRVTLRNVGAGPALQSFPLLALAREGAYPIHFTSCALSIADRAAGGSLPCGGVWTPERIEAGERVTLTGYVTMPLTIQSGMTVNLNGPRPKPRDIVVDIVADGCRANGMVSDLPSWCRIDEQNEMNNIGSAKLSLR